MNKNKKLIIVLLIIIGILLTTIGGYINTQRKNTVENENNSTTEETSKEDDSISKPIEEVRIDNFVNIAKTYGNAGKTLWVADGLTCNGTVSSEITDGEYYIEINTAETKLDPETNTFSTNEAITVPELINVKDAGKSPWNKREIVGYVKINVTASKPIFSVKITDDIHYILDNKEYLSLNSEDVKTDSNVKYKDALIDSTAIKCIENY